MGRYTREDFMDRTGKVHGRKTERPEAMKPPPLTCTARFRLGVCGQPAKRSYLGPRCADCFPRSIS
jgi:hypothetical protein